MTSRHTGLVYLHPPARDLEDRDLAARSPAVRILAIDAAVVVVVQAVDTGQLRAGCHSDAGWVFAVDQRVAVVVQAVVADLGSERVDLGIGGRAVVGVQHPVAVRVLWAGPGEIADDHGHEQGHEPPESSLHSRPLVRAAWAWWRARCIPVDSSRRFSSASGASPPWSLPHPSATVPVPGCPPARRNASSSHRGAGGRRWSCSR